MELGYSDSSHMIRAAAAEQVILFVLPPHTMHLTQSLIRDVLAH